MKRSSYALALLILFWSAAGSLPAATFNVGAGDVAGLKAAINTANSNGQDDTIILVSSTYTLTARDSFLNGLPQIGPDGGHTLTFQGNGATIQRVPAIDDAAHKFRIFEINSGASLTLSGLTLINGNPGASHGGAIYNNGTTAHATLTLVNCAFTGNSGDYGGAIWNDGSDGGAGGNSATLTVTNCTFSSNVGSPNGGGAIWNESGNITMNVSNSTFSQNSGGTHSAGAIQFDGSAGIATGSITSCTFTQNSAVDDYGGAINVDGNGGFNFNGHPISGSATLTVNNCTFDRNTAAWGGAIAIDGSTSSGTSGNATVTVQSCTFSGNLSGNLGDAIYLSETTSGTTVLQIGNSILAGTPVDPDFTITTDNINGGTVTVISSGYNLSDDAACGVSPCNDSGTGPGGLLNHSGDIRNTNPLLDPAGLKDNGGPTKTIALQATSPALDHGKSGGGLVFGSSDQRGQFRPFDDPAVANAAGGDGSDIGAYEATVQTTSQSRSGTTLTLSFTTILGHTYEIQSRPTLNPPSLWTTVNNTTPAPPITGTGGIVTVTIPNAIGGGAGFYRAHQLD